MFTVFEFTVVVVPFTVKLPVMIISFENVLLPVIVSANPIVTVPPLPKVIDEPLSIVISPEVPPNCNAVLPCTAVFEVEP